MSDTNTGIQAGRDVSVTGDVRVRMGTDYYYINNLNPGQEAEAVWFNVEEPVGWYTGRKSVLEKLRSVFMSSNILDRNGKTRCAVLQGPQGSGKSQVAAEFVRMYGSSYWNVLRFSCVSPTLIRLQLATLAETKFGFEARICVNTVDTTVVTEMKPTHTLVEAVYSKALLKPSLIIFDNVGDLKDIAEFLPKIITSTMTRPHVIVTTTAQTRDHLAANLFNVRSITVEEFSFEESVEFFENFLGSSIKSQEYEPLLEICQHHPGTLQLALSHLDVQRKRKNTVGGGDRYVENYFREEAKINRESLETNASVSDVYRTFYNLATASVGESTNGDFALKALRWMSFVLPGTLRKEFLFALFEHLGAEIVEEGLAVLTEHSLLPTNSAIVQLTREKMKAEETEVREVCEFLKAFRNVLSCIQNDVGLSNYYIANGIFVWKDTSNLWEHGEVLDFAKFFGAHLKRFNQVETLPFLKKINDFEANRPPSAESSQTQKLMSVAERDRGNQPEAARLYSEAIGTDLARIGWNDPALMGLELLEFGKHVLGPSHPDSLILHMGLKFIESLGVRRKVSTAKPNTDNSSTASTSETTKPNEPSQSDTKKPDEPSQSETNMPNWDVNDLD